MCRRTRNLNEVGVADVPSEGWTSRPFTSGGSPGRVLHPRRPEVGSSPRTRTRVGGRYGRCGSTLDALGPVSVLSGDLDTVPVSPARRLRWIQVKGSYQ